MVRFFVQLLILCSYGMPPASAIYHVSFVVHHIFNSVHPQMLS